VIAEGIEEQHQMTMVVKTGCRLGQGYLAGRPVLAEHFEARLQSLAPVIPNSRQPEMQINGGPATLRAQHVRSVDSSAEIRQS
jgi:predicted signal transduction protein with EAL and GGDEF domain